MQSSTLKISRHRGTQQLQASRVPFDPEIQVLEPLCVCVCVCVCMCEAGRGGGKVEYALK